MSPEAFLKYRERQQTKEASALGWTIKQLANAIRGGVRHGVPLAYRSAKGGAKLTGKGIAETYRGLRRASTAHGPSLVKDLRDSAKFMAGVGADATRLTGKGLYLSARYGVPLAAKGMYHTARLGEKGTAAVIGRPMMYGGIPLSGGIAYGLTGGLSPSSRPWGFSQPVINNNPFRR